MTPTPPTRHLNPKKLLLSKWTAVTPRNKEKHFIVTRLVAPEPPGQQVTSIELESVHSRRSVILPWRALMDGRQWRQGWT